jgi:phosphopantothenoylcysteine synthetase/decarboxylase
MNVLVTAGNTLVPIDRVRGLTNIFTGSTGAQIALEGWRRGHRVALLTSHPETVAGRAEDARLTVLPYRTFADLEQLLRERILEGSLDAIIHSAAVSDYQAAGVYAPAPHTHFRADGRWESSSPEMPAFVDRGADKVKSDESELWLRLVRTPKLIDQIRDPWGFRGVLVKFKLEVGIGDQKLLDIAERSRQHSGADLMAANTLEEKDCWAFLGPLAGRFHRIARHQLAERLLEEVERLHQERHHG